MSFIERPSGIFPWLMSLLLRLVVRLFFRQVDVSGLENIPKTGPVIFVGNHSNQFVDGMILHATCGREPAFLIAAKSWERRLVGTVARALGAIPVSRAQDNLKPGEGTVRKIGVCLHGHETCFMTSLKFGDQVKINDTMYRVNSIQSDTEATLDHDNDHEDDDDGSEHTDEFVTYDVSAKIDQSQMYTHVWDLLWEGGAVGIFPEGGSHDRTQLLSIKAGVCLMSLGAMKKYKGLEIKIVPVGLNYLEAHRFRSVVFIEYGAPITLHSDANLVDLYATDRRTACSELLKQVTESMESVFVSAPDEDTLALARTVRSLYQPREVKKVRSDQYLSLLRGFIQSFEMFESEPELIDLKHRVQHYRHQLEVYGLRDRQVEKLDLNPRFALELLTSRFLYFVLLFALATPGLLLHIPVGLLADAQSKQKALEALSKSSVKIRGRDVLASWKIIIATVALPSCYILYASVFFFNRIIYNDLLQTSIETFFFLCLMPILGFATIGILDQGWAVFSSLLPLLLTVVPVGRKNRRALKEMRNELQRDVVTMVERYGPIMYPDFESTRIFLKRHKSSASLASEIELMKIKLFAAQGDLERSKKELETSNIELKKSNEMRDLLLKQIEDLRSKNV